MQVVVSVVWVHLCQVCVVTPTSLVYIRLNHLIVAPQSKADYGASLSRIGSVYCR